MSRTSARVCTAALCAALAVSVAACGAAEPDPAAPVSGPDLFAALPSTPPPPPPTFEVVPTTTAAAPTTTTKPPRTTTSTRPRTEGAGGAAAPAAPEAPQLPWRQVAGDEFNGALDTGLWQPYDSVGGFGTGLRKPEAVTAENGALTITARGDVSGGVGHQFDQLYGRWEFRARTAPGRGFGSAILLWPESERWPQDGEVDIMEVPDENRGRAHFVLHWGENNDIHGGAVDADFAQWHTFAVEWLPDRITWYVDGRKRYENTDAIVIPRTPMHLTVQLDQGPKENWLPPRDETTPEEVALEVDWVRVYAL